jgi:hypothetical protein
MSLKDWLTGSVDVSDIDPVAKGKGNKSFKAAPVERDIHQEVVNQQAMGFGRTPEETWALNNQVREEMKGWRKERNQQIAEQGEEDKDPQW